MNYLIGIDIGTSGAKAVIIDREGNLLASAGKEYAIRTPQTGWAEQDPQDWLDAALNCVREVVSSAGVEPGDVAGIGITGQMHSMVCLDADGDVLRPAIIWADQRSAPQVRGLTSRIGQENLAEWTGNPLSAGFMLASWAWVRQNERSIVEKTYSLLLPKDYIKYRLTGILGTEPSDASSTLLFDPHLLDWSEPMLKVANLRRKQLPVVSPSHAVAGSLLPEVAKACNLRAGTPVVSGCSDVTAQALAMGIVDPGVVSVTIGTGGQLFAPLTAPHHDPGLRLHLFCHAVPGRWHQEAAILSAGLALRWLRDGMWPGVEYGYLANIAGDVEAAMDGLFFLPHLAGERTPYMDPGLRAAFIGLSLRHSQAHLVRGAMEGVVFAMRQGLDLMVSLGTPVERLIASGGSTRHPLWLQLQADIFDRPIYVSNTTEVTARGAAILAGIGAGVYRDFGHGLRLAVREPDRVIRPDPTRARRYSFAYRDFLLWSQMIADRYRVDEIT